MTPNWQKSRKSLSIMRFQNSKENTLSFYNPWDFASFSHHFDPLDREAASNFFLGKTVLTVLDNLFSGGKRQLK